jgi:hypothetical protein
MDDIGVQKVLEPLTDNLNGTCAHVLSYSLRIERIGQLTYPSGLDSGGQDGVDNSLGFLEVRHPKRAT